MERETTSIKTQSGYEVVYKTWISGGENNQLQAIYLKDIKVTGEGKIDSFNALSEFEAQKKMIELLVVSVNGKKENVLDLVENLPKADYDEIITALNLVAKKKLK